MSQNKNLVMMCFGIVGMAILACESCSYIGRVQKERQEEYRQSCQQRVQAVRDGPMTGQVTITTGHDLEIPRTLHIIKTAQYGKHQYSVVIEGPKEDLAKFLASFYGVDQ